MRRSRLLATAAATGAVMALSVGPASAHQLVVEPRGNGGGTTQAVHAGNTELPPHTGAFLRLQCNGVGNGNAAVRFASGLPC